MRYRRKRKTFKKRGVPKGFRHIWKYKPGLWKETKVKPGLWKFSYRVSKGKKSRSYGSFGKGTTGAWDIRARQYIKKTGKGKYDTYMVGTKKPLKFNVKKPKKKYKKYR